MLSSTFGKAREQLLQVPSLVICAYKSASPVLRCFDSFRMPVSYVASPRFPPLASNAPHRDVCFGLLAPTNADCRKTADKQARVAMTAPAQTLYPHRL